MSAPTATREFDQLAEWAPDVRALEAWVRLAVPGASETVFAWGDAELLRRAGRAAMALDEELHLSLTAVLSGAELATAAFLRDVADLLVIDLTAGAAPSEAIQQAVERRRQAGRATVLLSPTINDLAAGAWVIELRQGVVEAGT